MHWLMQACNDASINALIDAGVHVQWCIHKCIDWCIQEPMHDASRHKWINWCMQAQIRLDFSKAFDSVRHSTLIQKLARFPIPKRDSWIFWDSRQHGYIMHDVAHEGSWHGHRSVWIKKVQDNYMCWDMTSLDRSGLRTIHRRPSIRYSVQ